MNTGKHDYSFRNRNFQAISRLTPTPNACGEAGYPIDGSWEIVVPVTDSRLVRYFSEDLCRFFADAFGVYLRIRRTEEIQKYVYEKTNCIVLLEETDAQEYAIASNMAGAFHMQITESRVVVVGKTERGTAQGVYYLEDSMRLRGECTLLPENTEHAPLFSPRMTHSGMELDTFPDNFLEACAHAGMDAIIVYAGHPDTHIHGFEDPEALWPGTGRGYCDFNNLVWRAQGYGLDVYVYSHMLCDVHPEEPEAPAYYEASFGTLFRNCPGIKGVILVGETFEFPSKDPHTCGIRMQIRPADDPRPSPGWYPCSDYPQLVHRVKDTIRQYNPDADIVFWSYNWGWVEKEARLALIEHLPKDITLLVTFDMWETFIGENGRSYMIDDYSISFEGPSNVFVDEAEKAKEMGIRLYAMANTGGRTWDNGVVPYIPVPQQWQKRYEALCRANQNYGLCGLMENHHYGWLPSFLSLFSKNAFDVNGITNDEMLRQIANRDYGNCADLALQAWGYFSEGIRNVVASAIDQYGPYRCGPAYPLLFDQTMEDLQIPSVAWAWHKGGDIWNPIYRDQVFPAYENTLLRYNHVITVKNAFRKGVDLLNSAAVQLGAEFGSDIAQQITVAKFLYCTYVTTEHVIAWSMAKQMLLKSKENILPEGSDTICKVLKITEQTPAALMNFMKQIAVAETMNVSEALACWQEDSSIGFEASMEYAFNDVLAHWKNAETERSLMRLERFARGRVYSCYNKEDKMVKRRITLTNGYLHFPVCDAGEKKYVEILDGEHNMLADFHIGILQEEPYSYYPLKLHGMAGKTVEICCRDDVPEDYLECIIAGGAIEDHPDLYPDIYKEPDRQQIHFSSRRGWLNDPNGLVYTDGKYHMCYQHNPLGNRHGGVNISWGLTVSGDGVHFREYPDAIYPSDSKTHIASGSAIVDIDNISGKGKGTILGAYTALESRMFDGRQSVGTRGQILVYSTDGGCTFKQFPDNPIIPVPDGCDWRDPKILRMDDGSLCIAVYETHDGKNCVSFYSSTDCISWKFESRTMDLYECPDLFRLPVQETGEFLWVLYGANGMYRVGTFENYRFSQIGESMYLDYGKATYAGQTYNSHPDADGRYHIAWMNEDVWGEEKPSSVPFSQSMTILCRFTLHKTPDGYRLFRNPIQALDSLRIEPEDNWQLCMAENQNTTHQLPVPGETKLMMQGEKAVQVLVNGHGFTYDPVSKHLLFTSGKEYTLTSSKPFTVRIITDIRSVEFFICEEISATYISVDPQKVLNITGEDVQIQSQMWKMQSIWKETT